MLPIEYIIYRRDLPLRRVHVELFQRRFEQRRRDEAHANSVGADIPMCQVGWHALYRGLSGVSSLERRALIAGRMMLESYLVVLQL